MVDEIPPEAVIRMGETDAVPDEEPTNCPDCGIDAWRFLEGRRIVSEDFYVHDELWDTALDPASAVPR